MPSGVLERFTLLAALYSPSSLYDPSIRHPHSLYIHTAHVRWRAHSRACTHAPTCTHHPACSRTQLRAGSRRLPRAPSRAHPRRLSGQFVHGWRDVHGQRPHRRQLHAGAPAGRGGVRVSVRALASLRARA
eukprot:5705021-Pleurochrysis_carterae.AAC.5